MRGEGLRRHYTERMLALRQARRNNNNNNNNDDNNINKMNNKNDNNKKKNNNANTRESAHPLAHEHASPRARTPCAHLYFERDVTSTEFVDVMDRGNLSRACQGFQGCGLSIIPIRYLVPRVLLLRCV